MLGILFAVLCAAANAFSSVLQRKGARDTPPERSGGLRVIVDQLHHKVWFEGIGAMIIGFILQAVALSFGSLALVQPIIAIELPFTLIVAIPLLGGRPGRRGWIGIGLMTGGLIAALAAAAPTTGRPTATGPHWAIGVGAAVVVLGTLAVIGWHSTGVRRGALLGVVSGGTFGLTAVFISAVTENAKKGAGPLFGGWQLYAMAICGITAVIVLQQAYAAGKLTAAQPGVTITNPIVAAALGVFLFGEQIRLGWLLVPELAGAVALVLGAVELSRSPALHASSAAGDSSTAAGEEPDSDGPAGDEPDGDGEPRGDNHEPDGNDPVASRPADADRPGRVPAGSGAE